MTKRLPDTEPTDGEDGAIRPVSSEGVHARRRPGPTSGRDGLVLAAIVGVVVIGGLALRMAPAQTASSNESSAPAPTASAGTSPNNPTAAAGGPLATALESLAITAPPTIEPTATAAARSTPRPTKDPALDPGPTDSDHTDWTPPPGFTGTATLSDWCAHADGTEQIRMQADYHSPVAVGVVEFWMNGIYIARGGPGPDALDGSVVVGRDFQVGTTYVLLAKYFTGEYLVDLIATVKSAPYTVVQGDFCYGETPSP